MKHDDHVWLGLTSDSYQFRSTSRAGDHARGIRWSQEWAHDEAKYRMEQEAQVKRARRWDAVFKYALATLGVMLVLGVIGAFAGWAPWLLIVLIGVPLVPAVGLIIGTALFACGR